MRPVKLTLDTHVDNGWLYRVYCNQAAASYLSLISFSPVFKIKKKKSHFSQELWGQNSLNLVHLLTMGGCIMYTRIRLLLLICPFISSFFFLSNYQTLTIFITFFSGTVRPRKMKLGNMWTMGACIVYTGIRLLLLICPIFLSLQFSVTNLSFSSDSTITGL